MAAHAARLISCRRQVYHRLDSAVGSIYNMKTRYLFSILLLVWPFSAGAAQTPPGQSLAGITEPFLDVTMSAQVAGTVGRRGYKEGDPVKKGEVILELDRRMEELTVTRRKLVMDTLKTDVEGSRHLYETTKSVSKEELDRKETEYRVSVVDYETAVEQLNRRQLLAPMDGYITDYFIEVGEDCRAQDPLLRLVDIRRCYFVGNVEARAGHALKVDQTVSLEIEAGATSIQVEGKITYVAPIVDPASGLLRIKALFENPDGKVRPGVAGKMRWQSAP